MLGADSPTHILPPMSHVDQILQYEAHRKLMIEVGMAVMATATETEKDQAIARLMPNRGVANETTTDLLAEYLIHNTRRDGRPLIQVAETILSGLNEEQKTMLQAMVASHWDLYKVKSAEVGVGMDVDSCWENSGERFVFAREGSKNIQAGEFILARLFTMGPITQSSPLVIRVPDAFLRALTDQQQKGKLRPCHELVADHAFMEGLAISMLVASQRNVAIDQGELLPATHVAKTAGRNDPCPCESGKKYKKCCGA